MDNNYRPGVYSAYDVSSFYSAMTARKYAAIVAKGNAETDKLLVLTSYTAACQVVGPDEDGKYLRGCLKVLFESGVGQVYAVAAGNDYATSLALIEEIDDVGAVVCDCDQNADFEALRASVECSAKALRERIAFCGSDDVQNAIAVAKTISSERVCLCFAKSRPREMPNFTAAVYTAAAVAGAVLAANDAAHNFSGEILRTIEAPEKVSEVQIQALLAAGVSVVEQVGQVARLVRAMTTRTSVGGVEDRSLSALNTILIIDDVIVSVRQALQLRLGGGRVSTRSLESVSSQVTIELAAKQDDEIIESFLAPIVYAHTSDPSVCVVELSFKVAHVISQIHVVAHVQV